FVVGIPIAVGFAAQSGAPLWWFGAVLLLAIAAAAVCFADAPQIAAPAASRAAELSLWLLAIGCVVVTLISHRSDADDAFYVNVAVTTADIPQLALLSIDTMHGIPGLPLPLAVYRVDSYELLNGALSYLSGIPAIYCFHWISAAVAALLVPLA